MHALVLALLVGVLPSLRILTFGEEFAGILPDTLTDMTFYGRIPQESALWLRSAKPSLAIWGHGFFLGGALEQRGTTETRVYLPTHRDPSQRYGQAESEAVNRTLWLGLTPTRNWGISLRIHLPRHISTNSFHHIFLPQHAIATDRGEEVVQSHSISLRTSLSLPYGTIFAGFQNLSERQTLDRFHESAYLERNTRFKSSMQLEEFRSQKQGVGGFRYRRGSNIGFFELSLSYWSGSKEYRWENASYQNDSLTRHSTGEETVAIPSYREISVRAGWLKTVSWSSLSFYPGLLFLYSRTRSETLFDTALQFDRRATLRFPLALEARLRPFLFFVGSYIDLRYEHINWSLESPIEIETRKLIAFPIYNLGFQWRWTASTRITVVVYSEQPYFSQSVHLEILQNL